MMRNNKLNEANKSKNDQQGVAALSSSVKEIRHVANTNQQKLQHLELAIANLTTICSAIRHDMYSLNSSSSYNSLGKAQAAEVVEMKHPSSSRSSSSPRYDSKNDVLGVQMQQLVKQAATLGIHKDSNTNAIKFSGKMMADSKPLTRAVRKNVQASKYQRSSTKSSIRSKESTTENKMSVKLETVNKNNVGATHTKAKRSPEGSDVGMNKKANHTNNTSNVSLKSSSTVKRTKTTISKVYVNQQSASSKTKKDSTIVVKNNVEAMQGNGQNYSPNKHAMANRNTLSGAADSELRQPRKKWSTARQISFTK